MKKWKIKICGENWNYRLFSDDEWTKEHPDEDDSDALTEEPNMDFREGRISIGVCRHETRHAYVSECCIRSNTDMTPEDMEEINATLDEKKWDRMNRTAKTMFKNLSAQNEPSR